MSILVCKMLYIYCRKYRAWDGMGPMNEFSKQAVRAVSIWALVTHCSGTCLEAAACMTSCFWIMVMILYEFQASATDLELKCKNAKIKFKLTETFLKTPFLFK